MLKQLLAATAIVTVATAAHAAGTVNATSTTSGADAATVPAVTAMPAAGDMFLPAAATGDHLASKVIGLDVYDGAGQGANKIGTINDLVVADNGAVQAVVVGVGGFLGIGQKNVALDFANLQWSSVNNNPVLVAAITKDELTNAPTFDTAAIDNTQLPVTGTTANDQSQVAVTTPGTSAPMATNATGTMAAPDQTQMAQQNGAGTATTPATGMTANDQTQMAAQNNSTMPAATAPDESKMTTVDLASVSAKDLMNATVYAQDNQNVGNVGDVVLGQDGKIDALVLDVGGFLGLGTKPVAIGSNSLDIRKDANGNLVIFTHFTKDALESATAYDKDTYAAQRDTMRLSNP